MKKNWEAPALNSVELCETEKNINGNGIGQCKPNNGIGHGSDHFEFCS